MLNSIGFCLGWTLDFLIFWPQSQLSLRVRRSSRDTYPKIKEPVSGGQEWRKVRKLSFSCLVGFFEWGSLWAPLGVLPRWVASCVSEQGAEAFWLKCSCLPHQPGFVLLCRATSKLLQLPGLAAASLWLAHFRLFERMQRDSSLRLQLPSRWWFALNIPVPWVCPDLHVLCVSAVGTLCNQEYESVLWLQSACASRGQLSFTSRAVAITFRPRKLH